MHPGPQSSSKVSAPVKPATPTLADRSEHLSPRETFVDLLSQLRKEHEREIASRQNEIDALRKQLESHEFDSSKVEVATHDDITPSKSVRQSGRGFSLSNSGAKSVFSDNIIDPNATTSMFENEPAMNWKLDVMPEESFVGTRVAEFFAGTLIGRMCGLRGDRVKRFAEWWKNLKEPERPGCGGLRDLIDRKRFQSFILFCIFLNSMYIFYTTEADMQDALSEPWNYHSTGTKRERLAFDLIFTIIYTIELILKLVVHRCFFFLQDEWRWNVFDTILVVFSIFDTTMTIRFMEDSTDRPNLNFLRALRIMKITKVLRMARAVRQVQELRLMFDCVLNSVFHLFWAVVLIVLVLVIFSLLLVQGMTHEVAAAYLEGPQQHESIKASIDGYFDSVPQTMLSLFKATTGGEDWSDFYVICKLAGHFYEAIFLFYIAFFCIVAWNIVMSTFVEKTFKLAVPDIETMMMHKRKMDFAYSKELLEIIKSRLDENNSGTISLAEFRQHFQDPVLTQWFQARDFDMKDAELFFRMLASVNKKKEVDVQTFVLGCMRLRGTASNIDLQALHYEMRNMHMKQQAAFHHLSQHMFAYLEREGMERSNSNATMSQNGSCCLDTRGESKAGSSTWRTRMQKKFPVPDNISTQLLEEPAAKFLPKQPQTERTF